jgi:hypothetical protein
VQCPDKERSLGATAVVLVGDVAGGYLSLPDLIEFDRVIGARIANEQFFTAGT